MTNPTPSISEPGELAKLENLLSAGRRWREARTAYMTDSSVTSREYGLAGDALALAISAFDSRTAVAPLLPRPQPFDEGIWYRSAVSGLWYDAKSKDAAGDINAVRVDGKVFAATPSLPSVAPAGECFCGTELEAGICPNGHDPITTPALVDEAQRRMDQVVEAAVEWRQAGREGGEWFDKAEELSAAIDSLLELRSAPAVPVVVGEGEQDATARIEAIAQPWICVEDKPCEDAVAVHWDEMIAALVGAFQRSALSPSDAARAAAKEIRERFLPDHRAATGATAARDEIAAIISKHLGLAGVPEQTVPTFRTTKEAMEWAQRNNIPAVIPVTEDNK